MLPDSESTQRSVRNEVESKDTNRFLKKSLIKKCSLVLLKIATYCLNSKILKIYFNYNVLVCNSVKNPLRGTKGYNYNDFK